MLPARAGSPASESSPKEQLVETRGVWVTRWDYHTPEDVSKIMQKLQRAGFNQVYFQVRGTADAYYHSTYEPWAASLAGKLGRDPGWDPLQVAVDEAHRRGLQLHAWINLCTAWKGTSPPGRSRPKHILRAHPGWRVRDNRKKPMPYTDRAYVFVNPVHPKFQAHLESVVAEIASFYQVDGVHLDYARYPGRDFSYDAISRKLFRKARKKQPGLRRGDWQRQELSRLIKRLTQKVHEVRPNAVVSAAVTGIYRDRWKWGGVTQGYVDFYQDSKGWAVLGAVDCLVPMIYWPPARRPKARTDFVTLVDDFLQVDSEVQLLVGINVEAGGFDVLTREIELVRKRGLDGVVLFAYSGLVKRGWLERLAKGPFALHAVAAKVERPTLLDRFFDVAQTTGSVVVRKVQPLLASFEWIVTRMPMAFFLCSHPSQEDESNSQESGYEDGNGP